MISTDISNYYKDEDIIYLYDEIKLSSSSAADAPAAQVMSVFRLIWHVVVATPYLLSTILLILIYRDNRRGENQQWGSRSVAASEPVQVCVSLLFSFLLQLLGLLEETEATMSSWRPKRTNPDTDIKYHSVYVCLCYIFIGEYFHFMPIEERKVWWINGNKRC